MAKNTIADLDTTAANNTDVLGGSTAGTALVNTFDNRLRDTFALLARFYADLGGVVTVGGTADAITITTASTYQALENGLTISFKASGANTGAATVNVDSLGAKAIRHKGDTALGANAMLENGRYLIQYDTAYNSAAGAWVLLNPEAAGTDLSAYAKLDTADQVVTGGARITPLEIGGGTVSSGTVTPDPGDRPIQYYTNGGAHTLAPGSNKGSYILEITNNASAGAITTSGWTKVSGSFSTTNNHKFHCSCVVGQGYSSLTILALQ
jgi:hypothetical protein